MALHRFHPCGPVQRGEVSLMTRRSSAHRTNCPANKLAALRLSLRRHLGRAYCSSHGLGPRSSDCGLCRRAGDCLARGQILSPETPPPSRRACLRRHASQRAALRARVTRALAVVVRPWTIGMGLADPTGPVTPFTLFTHARILVRSLIPPDRVWCLSGTRVFVIWHHRSQTGGASCRSSARWCARSHLTRPANLSEPRAG